MFANPAKTINPPKPVIQYPAQAREPSGFRNSRLASVEIKRIGY
jgi:hypothetical protein